MGELAKRLARALVAYRRSQAIKGETALTTEQYEALVDQIALVCEERQGQGFDYAAFRAACGLED